MGKVIPIDGITLLKIPVDNVLEGGKDKLTDVIILGYTKDDMEYFACTFADYKDVLWLLERYKTLLLNNAEMEDYDE